MSNPVRTLSSVVSCLSDYDPDALPVAQARDIIADFIEPIDAVEHVALPAALGRVLAADVISPADVPAHDNSAMDGYAFASSDLTTQTDLTLNVVGTAF
ncbi:MAG: molybdopterin molybdenumtransferase MoeA, partial [Herminiimonas sp.]|nr:molybdopterin molybdenumtransferase MoeA [Herminiimonas sp.]